MNLALTGAELGLELVKLAVKTLGGYDQVQAVLDAERAVADAVVDVLEEQKIARESAP